MESVKRAVTDMLLPRLTAIDSRIDHLEMHAGDMVAEAEELQGLVQGLLEATLQLQGGSSVQFADAERDRDDDEEVFDDEGMLSAQDVQSMIATAMEELESRLLEHIDSFERAESIKSNQCPGDLLTYQQCREHGGQGWTTVGTGCGDDLGECAF